MLILTRKSGQSIVIDGRIVVTFMGRDHQRRDGSIKLGISAPADVPVMRQELLGLEGPKPTMPPKPVRGGSHPLDPSPWV